MVISPFLLFILFLGTLVVDDLHVLGGDQLHSVLPGPGHAALQHHRQKHTGYVEDGLQGVVGELDLVVPFLEFIFMILSYMKNIKIIKKFTLYLLL